jgi:hypothetical protein
MTKRKVKECITHACIHFRTGKPEYCVEVDCRTHESTWQALTDDFDFAVEIVRSFPILASGGIATGKDAYPIPGDCLLSKIPRKVAI